MHPKQEQTFVMVKPDGVQRSLVGEVLARVEKTGLKLVALKMVNVNRDQLVAHYAKDDAWCEKVGGRTIDEMTAQGTPVTKSALEYGRDVLEKLYSFMLSGPVVQMIFEGNQAVGVVKKIVGATEPLTSDVGTIRGDFTVDSYGLANVDGRAVRNLVHCSDQVDEAKREIGVWFTASEILKYTHINERVMYDIDFNCQID
jgi:nucleoside-diphosphate kinase